MYLHIIFDGMRTECHVHCYVQMQVLACHIIYEKCRARAIIQTLTLSPLLSSIESVLWPTEYTTTTTTTTSEERCSPHCEAHCIHARSRVAGPTILIKDGE